MMERLAASPRFTARMAGLCYLLMMVVGVLTALPSRGLVVAGDAAATATNIIAHPFRVQLGIAGEFLVVAFYVGVTALLYSLLKAVNHTVSLLAAFFSLVACAIQGAAVLFLMAPVAALGDATYLSAFAPQQIQPLALFSLKLYGQAYSIALVFFGFYCFLIGCLVFRSTFLPRIIGVLMAIAGVSWLTFLSPALCLSLRPYNMATAVGELALTLWLLGAGVNEVRWREQAGERLERQP